VMAKEGCHGSLTPPNTTKNTPMNSLKNNNNNNNNNELL
jgi:hypothetical protein